LLILILFLHLHCPHFRSLPYLAYFHLLHKQYPGRFLSSLLGPGPAPLLLGPLLWFMLLGSRPKLPGGGALLLSSINLPFSGVGGNLSGVFVSRATLIGREGPWGEQLAAPCCTGGNRFPEHWHGFWQGIWRLKSFGKISVRVRVPRTSGRRFLISFTTAFLKTSRISSGAFSFMILGKQFNLIISPN
jgi:hypothetical protein